ncbi:MAG TPA: hypothetical protein VFO89_04355 [Thermoanaerobaculia bacterium]|nr:hypothetical protein [Thermoanaerobaculia bacterium]
MTKRELLSRLVYEPIAIEPVGMGGYHRISLHAERDTKDGVWIEFASSTRAPVVQDRATAYACVNGQLLRLTGREVESVISRVRGIFAFSG